MGLNYFQINKKNIIAAFKKYTDKHSDRADDYNPSHAKPTDNTSSYFILDRIRGLYHWIIEQSKLNLRRKYIHDDKEYKKILGKLENYTRNKIKSEKDGTMYLRVNNQITFRGDKKEYRDHLVQSRNKQVSIVKKIVDELNGVLAGKEIEDENKPILNDTSPRMVHKEHTSEEVADIILKEVPEDYLLEIVDENFNNFNNKLYVILDKYKVTAADTKEILNKIQESFTKQEENENGNESEPETDNTESENEEL